MEDSQPRECRKCDIAWGLIGIGFGAVLLILGIDLISQGALTKAVTRQEPLAPVVPIRSDDHVG